MEILGHCPNQVYWSLVAKAMLADGVSIVVPHSIKKLQPVLPGYSCIRATTDGLMNVELNAIVFFGNLPV